MAFLNLRHFGWGGPLLAGGIVSLAVLLFYAALGWVYVRHARSQQVQAPEGLRNAVPDKVGHMENCIREAFEGFRAHPGLHWYLPAANMGKFSLQQVLLVSLAGRGLIQTWSILAVEVLVFSVSFKLQPYESRWRNVLLISTGGWLSLLGAMSLMNNYQNGTNQDVLAWLCIAAISAVLLVIVTELVASSLSQLSKFLHSKKIHKSKIVPSRSEREIANLSLSYIPPQKISELPRVSAVFSSHEIAKAPNNRGLHSKNVPKSLTKLASMSNFSSARQLTYEISKPVPIIVHEKHLVANKIVRPRFVSKGSRLSYKGQSRDLKDPKTNSCDSTLNELPLRTQISAEPNSLTTSSHREVPFGMKTISRQTQFGVIHS